MWLCSTVALSIMSGASGSCHPSPVRGVSEGQERSGKRSLRRIAMFSDELIPESSRLKLEVLGMPRLNISLT